ncbi:protocadherin gamma-C5-like isoform 4-T4 [Anomaloglossus baeobatrachus]
MDNQSFVKAWKWQVAFSLLLCSWGWVSGQLRYSIAEESHPGTVVGNVAQDLGVNLADISRRRLSLGSEGNSRLFSIEQKNGALVVQERIDRESLCGSSLSCVLHLEAVAENPLELHSLEIDILDINDNSPYFLSTNQVIKITELLTPQGEQFPLENAQDFDVGINGISQYKLNPNPYFSLSITKDSGNFIAELVLDKILDREEKSEHKLILTAIDGGDPARSGSTQITIIVLDINDNAPVFDQSRYKVQILENVPLNTVIIKLNATDSDEGINSEFTYSIDQRTSNSAKEIFDINPITGEVFVRGAVDFEAFTNSELFIKAIDNGSPKREGRCRIQIEIQDVNDNDPEIIFVSKNIEIPENAPIGIVVGFITVKDKDSGKNGETMLTSSPNLPFTCQPMSQRYALVTSGHLDREKLSQYTIILTASDLGSPSLSSQIIISLNISDVNDNPPAFLHNVYNAFIPENNEAGRLLCTVSAVDLDDEGANAKLIYSIAESHIHGSPVSSFVYINSDTGNIYAQRSFDYEQFQVLQITARVEDSGSPKLSSNVSVFIFILDTNDNPPTILYPENTGETIAQETIPRSAAAGYLVSKVSAVDVDSGHNAWLLYSLVQSASPALFHISEYTGEVRTLRGLHETDNTEQRLVIAVRDHGEPSMTTTATIIVNLLDTVAQESPRSQDYLTNTKSTPDLTLYLIVSLVAISAVFLVTFSILLVRCLRKNYGPGCGFCFTDKSLSPSYMDQYKPTLYLNTDGTLKYMEVRMAPPEAPGSCYPACFPPSAAVTGFTLSKTDNVPQLCEPTRAPNPLSNSEWSNDPNQQAQPNAEWRFSQAQRPGPSGAQPTEEAGVWPNNQFETERLQAMILASANEAAEGTSGLGGGTGTMGLSARYGPQFTLQHVPDYRQNVYIPGSTLTPTNAGGKRDGKGGGNKKKSGKKDKK